MIRTVLWALFFSLVFAGGALLLPACGLRPWGVDACPTPVRPSPISLAAERQAELLEIRNDLLATANLAPQCRIAEASIPEPPEPEQTADCQPPRSAEVLILVDVSMSMRWDFDADPALLAKMRDTPPGTGQGGLAGMFADMARQMEYDAARTQLDNGPGIDRIDLARSALVELGRSVPADVELNLLSFAECGRPPQQEGRFGSASRDGYESAVRGLGLRGNTALAEAIGAVPNLTEGGRASDRPVNVVILSDGEDNCSGDPCAAARALKANLPYASVSVISMAEAANANACIADGADGSFFRITDIEDLTRRLRQASGLLSAEECAALPASEGPEGKDSNR